MSMGNSVTVYLSDPVRTIKVTGGSQFEVHPVGNGYIVLIRDASGHPEVRDATSDRAAALRTADTFARLFNARVSKRHS